MFALKTTLVLAAMLSTLDGVMAGATVHIYGCVNYQVRPSTPFNVHLSPQNSANHCMLKTGSDVDIKVSDAGVTCGEIGDVESKTSSTGGDTCATDDHYWHLGYKTAAGKSGTTSSEWIHNLVASDHINLKDSPNGTVICGSKDMCTATEYTWKSGNPDVYVIFQPDMTSFGPVSESTNTDAYYVEQGVLEMVAARIAGSFRMFF